VDVRSVLYLVGDAGEDSPERAVVLDSLEADLTRHASAFPGAPAVVLFLGDNIYEVGAREAFEDEDFAHLAAQAGVIGRTPRARAVFLPGNHDWAKGAGDEPALQAVKIQAAWIRDRIEGDRAVFRPDDGCAGPAVMDLGADVRLVFLDTEWLLRRPPSACPSAAEVYRALQAELAASVGRRVIVAAHHPMATGGPHGGNVGIFEHGPLVYWLAVKSGLGVQDLASGRYAAMLEGLRAAIRDSGIRPLAFVAGHDHSLQVIRMRGAEHPQFQLVSGSGSRTTPTDRIEGTRWAGGRNGYMRIEFGEATSRLTVFALDGGDELGPAFTCTLAVDPDACPAARLVER
jgi:hypothetical protein